MNTTIKHAADMYLALTDAWKDWDENGETSEDYLLKADNMERFAATIATKYETLRATTNTGAIILTPTTIKASIDEVKATHGWTETGWTETMNDNQPTTLTDLADWWAEQEANEDPEDRASLEAWLLDHINDEVIAPPKE